MNQVSDDYVIGRIVAVDYGRKRIGLAISDPTGVIASPAGAIPAAAAPDDDARRVVEWVGEHEGDEIVVGMPYNMDDTLGPQAKLTQRFVDALRRCATCPVHVCDERLTSYQADEWLRQRGEKRSKARGARDALAALAILQNYLATLTRRDDDRPGDGGE